MVERGPLLAQLQTRLTQQDQALEKVRSAREQLANGAPNKNPLYNLSDKVELDYLVTALRIDLALQKVDDKLPVLNSRRQSTEELLTQTNTRLTRLEESAKAGRLSPAIVEEARRQLLFSLGEKPVAVDHPSDLVPQPQPLKPDKRSKPGESTEVFGKTLDGLTPIRKKIIEILLTASEATPITIDQWAEKVYDNVGQPGGTSIEKARSRLYVLKHTIDGDLVKIGYHVVTTFSRTVTETRGTRKGVPIALHYLAPLSDEKKAPILQDIVDRMGGLPSNPKYKMILEGVLSNSTLPTDAEELARAMYGAELNAGQLTMGEATIKVSDVISKLNKDLRKQGMAIINTTSRRDLRSGKSSAYLLSWTEEEK